MIEILAAVAEDGKVPKIDFVDLAFRHFEEECLSLRYQQSQKIISRFIAFVGAFDDVESTWILFVASRSSIGGSMWDLSGRQEVAEKVLPLVTRRVRSKKEGLVEANPVNLLVNRTAFEPMI